MGASTALWRCTIRSGGWVERSRRHGLAGHHSRSENAPIAPPPDIRWQQRFANRCQALEQLETFFLPPALNERGRQGLRKSFEY